MIYWITGRKNSGKTTLSKKLAKQIDGVILDGDEIRNAMDNKYFTKSGIEQNLKDIITMAIAAHLKQRNVVIACVSPYAEMRKKYQAMLPGCIEIEMPFGEMWSWTIYEPTEYK